MRSKIKLKLSFLIAFSIVKKIKICYNILVEKVTNKEVFMKILEKGKGPDWKLEVTCDIIKDKEGLTYDDDKKHCNSKLEINDEDVEVVHWEKWYESGKDYIVRCPVCENRIWLDPDKLPNWVKGEADRRYIAAKNAEIKSSTNEE